MGEMKIEHVNITVSDPKAEAQWLCDVFGWQVRWQGEAKNGGFTVHVGGAGSYLALYAHPERHVTGEDSYTTIGGLNHVGILVDDLDETEERVRQAGFAPHSHADYEPGRRFYFHDRDNIEFEVISYSG